MDIESPPKSIAQKMRKFCFYSIIAVAGLAVSCLTGFYIFMRASLPPLSGTLEVTGIESPITVERDSLGVPTITGASRLDVAFALGFIHAQDRFFQMDLLRHAAAGELSELFGAKAFEFDKSRRIHQPRKVLAAVYANFRPEEKELLKSYSAGVNSGLASLSARPFEYGVLGLTPKPWNPEDCLLVTYNLYFSLGDSQGTADMTRGVMKECLPPKVYDFFINNGSTWDAPLDASILPIRPVPHAEDFAYLNTAKPITEEMARAEVAPTRGASNEWATAGTKRRDAKAMLACDMHLDLSVPNIWYRAELCYRAASDELVRVCGVTWPGTPCMVIGSNGSIAWGMTCDFVDTTDLVILEQNPDDSSLYRTPDGWQSFDEEVETINIKGQKSVTFPIRKTIWGPVIHDKFFGSPLALRWIAHDSDCINMSLGELETAHDVQEAMQVAKRVKLPLLNFLVADSKGNIGWSIMGGVPERQGFSGVVPVSFADGTYSWLGNLDPEKYPRMINPSSGCLWTANNRCVGTSAGDFYNQEGFLNSIRAWQIRQKLLSLDNPSEQDFFALQLETRAPFFDRWQKKLIEVLQKAPETAPRKELLECVKKWDGTCEAQTLGYYWIRAFRDAVREKILHQVFSPCYHAWSGFTYHGRDYEEPVWMIVEARPSYLVDPSAGSWDREFLQIVDTLLKDNHNKVAGEYWGKHNTLHMSHPFSRAMPFLSFVLDMPREELSGDFFVPRVATPKNGASERMVVSPGKEESAILHMPGGQSGHPLSPYYRLGHEDWVQGVPTRFLPGPTENTLRLVPNNM
jgi:penicillin amidase